MKSLPAIITIFGVICFKSVNGISNTPADPAVVAAPKPIVCTMNYPICSKGQYLGTGSNGCPKCQPCPECAMPVCPVGSSPQEDPPVQNKCPTYSCPKKPVCPKIRRICPDGQYLGVGANGCDECQECPKCKPAPCPDGTWPREDPPVKNQCPTYSCPQIACTAQYKTCKRGEYWGIGPNGCSDCLRCPDVLPARCEDGSAPKLDPPVENQCPTYSCPKKPCV